MKIFHDSLVHFLLLGVLLFFGYNWLNPEHEKSVIEIGPALVAQIEQKWALQWGRGPTEQELQDLIETHVREQVLSREAIAMGLDRDDPVIRRRLAQKVDFLIDDVSNLEQLDNASLSEYFQNNLELFTSEPLYSFHHVYINPDKHHGKDDFIKDLLNQLQSKAITSSDAKNYGDPFITGISFTRQSRSRINRVFGKGFAEALSGLELKQWSGPVSSGYGLHLIFLEDYQAPLQAEFDDVLEEVKKHYLWVRRQALKEKAYQELRQRYQVNVIGKD